MQRVTIKKQAEWAKVLIVYNSNLAKVTKTKKEKLTKEVYKNTLSNECKLYNHSLGNTANFNVYENYLISSVFKIASS